MQTLKLGFALEGNSDYPVIPHLSRRLVSDHFADIALSEDSVLRPRKRGHGFIREMPAFARQLIDDGAHVLVAVVDTDDTQIGERLKLLRETVQRCAELSRPICIAEGMAVRSLEAWLLADETAIFQIFDGDRANVNFPSPERDPDPKTRLNQIVRTLTSGREITFAPFANELAMSIRLVTLRQKCPHFDEFARNFINCVKEWRRLELGRRG